jgi:hypothetical protein
MIELIDFILYNQDYDLPIAVLAITFDFSKAFNRQNHNILITTLSDMGVPVWLLNIVMGFLKDRDMVVRFRGETAEAKQQPGGGPQGTLLRLLLFLILINFCGFETNTTNIGEMITNPKKKFENPTLHTKYVDDLMIAEAINLKETIVPNPCRPIPANYHVRLGLKLGPEKSKVYETKTKFIVFNPTINFDFSPGLELGSNQFETKERMKLLGLELSNDLSWKKMWTNIPELGLVKPATTLSFSVIGEFA